MVTQPGTLGFGDSEVIVAVDMPCIIGLGTIICPFVCLPHLSHTSITAMVAQPCHAAPVRVKPLALPRPHGLWLAPMADRQFDTTLPVRVDHELLEACRSAADADSRTLGSWVRLVLREASSKIVEIQAKKPVPKKVRRKA
jgi:hypothetical protein